MEAIHELIASHGTPEEILPLILQECAQALECPTAMMALRENNQWIVRHIHGLPPDRVGSVLDSNESRLAQTAVNAAAPVAISDAEHDDRLDSESIRRMDVRSAMVWPIRAGSEVIGLMLFTYRDVAFQFQPAHHAFAEKASMVIGLKLENLRLLSQVHSEIHARRQLEVELHDREEQFRTMFKTTRVGMAEADPFTLRLLRVTDGLAEMSGYTTAELANRNLLDLTPVEERRHNWECYSRLMFNEVPNYELEKRFLRKDGSIFWTYTTLTLVRDANHQPLRTVAIVKNITERKAAEEALRESEKCLRLALEATRLGLWEWDFAAHRIYWSDEARRISGLPQDVRSADVDDLRRLVHPEDAATIQAVQQCVLENKPFESEYRIIRPNGEIRWVSNHGRIDCNDAGVPVRMIGTVADITERKEAERALHEAQARMQSYAVDLERSVAERTAELREMINDLHQVSYAMIHDLRAPLRAMRGFAELLTEMSTETTPPKAREFQRRIIVAAARLDKMITDALNFTRVLHQQLPMEPVNLHKLILGLLETYPKLQPGLADIEIVEPLPAVMGNESLLTQCFSNLLSNAVKFVAPGTRPKVRIYAENPQSITDETLGPSNGTGESAETFSRSRLPPPAPDHVRIWIEDNGVGLPPDVRHRLFGIFQRFDANQEGTGIGLAIVRKVTERMGGTVGAESEPGQGSRFWVELPAPTF